MAAKRLFGKWLFLKYVTKVLHHWIILAANGCLIKSFVIRLNACTIHLILNICVYFWEICFLAKLIFAPASVTIPINFSTPMSIRTFWISLVKKFAVWFVSEKSKIFQEFLYHYLDK